MALVSPLSSAGLDADLDALLATHGALVGQQALLQNLVNQHNVSKCIPSNLESQVRKAAYGSPFDRDVLETLLLVGVIASFQKFIKVLVSDVLTTVKKGHAKFSQIDQSIRDSYIIAAAATYRYKKSGSVRGVRVNFHLIEKSMRECLNDDSNYSLESDCITAEMGNPNQTAIVAAFGGLGLKDPFDSDLGVKLSAAGWSQGGTDLDNLNNALKKLSRNIERRNDAVHGMQKIVFSTGELEEILEFFRILGKCLFQKVDAAI